MLELGEFALALHEECGRAAAGVGLRLLIAIGGPPALAMADAAVAVGMPAAAVQHFASSADAAPAVSAWLHEGDLVLVKGSRGTRCDLIVDRLRQERG
jgi:UDP-N-acetylmuramoyl-tripeptide--D-alanyl-D-alanine ligase